MKKIVYILYQPYKWLIFIPCLALSTIFFTCVALILVVVTNTRIASLFAGVLWARLNSYLTPIFVKVVGRENIDKGQSYVIVVNHQSNYDIFVLYGWLGVDFKWIMKQELRKVPVLGIGAEKLGHIIIDRSNSQAAIASINETREKIANGTSALFFPEGTRSRNGKLGTFKKGAFKMAIDIGLPILPITIIGTRDILPPKTMNLLPGTAKMIIHKPIDIDGYDDKNIQELMKKARELIESDLDNY